MTTPVRILVVDDDSDIRRSMEMELRAQGYETVTASNGREAIEIMTRHKPDLILTDLSMPVLDGFDFIRLVRKNHRTPVVVLSVRGGESDRVRALDLGADDFVAKPFSLAELLARVRAQLRRSGLSTAGKLGFPGLQIDFERRRVAVEGNDVHLTRTEFSLLSLLASNAGRVLMTDQILARVWKDAPATGVETLRAHIAALRRKIEPDPSSPRYIVTEPWVGYRFIAEPLEE